MTIGIMLLSPEQLVRKIRDSPMRAPASPVVCRSGQVFALKTDPAGRRMSAAGSLARLTGAAKAAATVVLENRDFADQHGARP